MTKRKNIAMDFKNSSCLPSKLPILQNLRAYFFNTLKMLILHVEISAAFETENEKECRKWRICVINCVYRWFCWDIWLHLCFYWASVHSYTKENHVYCSCKSNPLYLPHCASSRLVMEILNEEKNTNSYMEKIPSPGHMYHRQLCVPWSVSWESWWEVV